MQSGSHICITDRSEFTVDNVTLERDGYRQLAARWSCPDHFMDDFMVTLYGKHNLSNNNNNWEQFYEVRRKDGLSKFSNLKCEHQYYCEVAPVHDGRPKRSNIVCTDKSKMCVYFIYYNLDHKMPLFL